jgi:hypothetical protein
VELTDRALSALPGASALTQESVVFVPGPPFCVDPGGAHELRLCSTAQPVERAPVAARVLERSIAAARTT